MSSSSASVRRTAATGVVLAVLLPAAVLYSAFSGPADIELRSVAGIILRQVTGGTDGSWLQWQETVVVNVRLPRVMMAVLVGGALATCGAVMQGLFRNPMAGPGIIGVTNGAAFGAVMAIFLQHNTGIGAWLLASFGMLLIPGCAFAGALVCAFLVYAIATTGGRTSVTTLILCGVAVGGLAAAMTSFVLSLSLESFEVARQAVFWLMGGLQARTWLHVRMTAPIVIGGALLLYCHARDLNVLATGDETALSLGLDVPRVRRNLLIWSAAITAAAVAFSGSIVFVGLVVPHMMRRIVGPDHRVLLPASFVAGSILLVLADLCARTLAPPTELSLGVLTSFIGAPFFLYLLIAHRQRVEEL